MARITKKQVQDAAEQMASEAWLRREIPGELERIREIRDLTREQLHDDTWSTSGAARDRIGGAWVAHHSIGDREMVGSDGEPIFSIWRERTEEELALEEGMSPYLDALSPEDRSLVWMIHDGGEEGPISEREIARRLSTDRVEVRRRLRGVYRRLRKDFTKAFTLEAAS